MGFEAEKRLKGAIGKQEDLVGAIVEVQARGEGSWDQGRSSESGGNGPNMYNLKVEWRG